MHDPLAGLQRAIEALTRRRASNQELDNFRRYLELLLVWNRVQHLTSLTSPAAIASELFADSLLFFPLLPRRPVVMADIGAGAGIPGVPLRVIDPAISLTLIEAKRKRVSFLLALKRELSLADVEILEGRAELISREHPDLLGRFDVVVARAVGSAILPMAMRYLKPAGLFVASGPPPERGLPPAPNLAEWREVSFPDLSLRRLFLVASKPA